MNGIVIGITGASGAVYAKRLIEALAREKRHIHLVASRMGKVLYEQETGTSFEQLVSEHREFIVVHDDENLAAPVASGTCRTGGMAIVPASMDVCGQVASGLAPTLITRAAAVAMKEGRRLVIVPRETPMSAIHLEQLSKLAAAGVVVLPACPAFYTKPESIGDMVDFIVQKVCDSLDVPVELSPRWS
ncbi:MAG: UbiX family flavin prenyltransferase [Planctomycetota bacterium]